MSTKIKKVLHDQIDFNSYLREKTVIVSPVDQYDISDIIMMIFSSPSSQPLLPEQGLVSPEDVRFYVNGQSYTKALKDELKNLLQKEDSNQVKRQYEMGVNTWLKYFGKFNFDNVDINHEKDVFKDILSHHLPDQLDTLGSHQVGALGNLHIFNYLYKNISLEAISLNSLITRKFGADGKIKTVKDLLPLKLTFSSGPAPSFEDFDTHFQPRGILRYVIDFVYDNPLYDLMQQIRQQGGAIQKQLEDQRTNYLDPTVNELQTLQSDTKLKLDEINTSIGEVDKSIKVIKDVQKQN